MSKLILLYDPEVRDPPIDQLEAMVRGWDEVTALRPERVLTIRFSGSTVLNCVTCLMLEGELKCEIEVEVDETPTQIGEDGTIEPWPVPNHEQDWVERRVRAYSKEST